MPTNWELRLLMGPFQESVEVRVVDTVRSRVGYLSCSTPNAVGQLTCTSTIGLAGSTTFDVAVTTFYTVGAESDAFQITTTMSNDDTAPGPVEIMDHEWVERDSPFLGADEAGRTRGVRLNVRAPDDAALVEVEILESDAAEPAIVPAHIEGDGSGAGTIFLGDAPCACISRVASDMLSDGARLRVRAIDAAGNEGPWSDEASAVVVNTGCSATSGQPSMVMWLVLALAVLHWRRRRT